MKTIREMKVKAFCTRISLKTGAAVCSGTLLFAEGLAIEIAVKIF